MGEEKVKDETMEDRQDTANNHLIYSISIANRFVHSLNDYTEIVE